MTRAKGYLVAIGGAEDKGVGNLNNLNNASATKRLDFFEEGILKQIVKLIAHHPDPRIELITTASTMPDEVARMYEAAFEKLGVHNVGHLYIRHREEADSDELVNRTMKCQCIVFSGGDQLRLSTILGGTRLMAKIKKRYQNEAFVVAGTSAGAMAMSTTMIYEGSAAKAHLKGEVKFTNGFGFLADVIIDTHFEKRGRFNRLVQAVAVQPGVLGIGLAEDTGMIVHPGLRTEVIGSGIVTIVNGKNISSTNLGEINDGMPISVEHILVHILSKGEYYNLTSRQKIKTLHPPKD
jgi:cyanophycinase